MWWSRMQAGRQARLEAAAGLVIVGATLMILYHCRLSIHWTPPAADSPPHEHGMNTHSHLKIVVVIEVVVVIESKR